MYNNHPCSMYMHTYNYSLACHNYYVLYKMKYWQGVNFGDWRFLDKWPTFNPPIIVHMCHFLPHHVINAKWHCCSILRELTNPKFPYHRSWIPYQNTSCNKWMTVYASIPMSQRQHAHYKLNLNCNFMSI